MRLLPTVRLSLENDESTSPERQMAKMQNHAQFNDHTLIPIGPDDYDLGVSGSVSPWDRPGLGKWLQDDRLGEWDGLICAKLDRLTRSLLDFERLVKWLQERGKVLVCLDPALDLSTPAGKAFAQVIVVFAEFERATIGARVRDAYHKLQLEKKYPGGQLGFGYKAVKLDKGWGIEPDEEYAPIVAEMCARYLQYESLGALSRWLNETGVPSPRDAIRKRAGRPLQGTRWSATVVRVVLQGPRILGAVVRVDGEPMRDDEGAIVYRAPALVDRDTWERVQARLSANRGSAKVNTWLLTQVVFCGECKSPAYGTLTRAGGKEFLYYICAVANKHDGRCGAKRIKAERLEGKVSGALLDLVGSYELVERRMVAGRDYAEDIARIKDQLSHLAGDIEMGEALGDDVTALAAKRDRVRVELRRLLSLEPTPARVEKVKTGKKFHQHWESLGTVQRNEFLRSAGVRATAHKDELPPIDVEPGPLTPLEIPRTVIIDEDGVKGVVHLGNLGDLLARASVA